MTARASTQVERLQVLPELVPDVLSLQRQLYRRSEPAHRGPGIVSHAVEGVGVDVLFFHQRLDRIGQLDLAAGPSGRLLELVEDLRRQDVAADDGQVRGRV